MVGEPDATMRPAPQDNQLMSKRRVLGFKPQVRLEWRGQDDPNETEQPDHSASLGDSITSSTQIRFSVHTAATFTLDSDDLSKLRAAKIESQAHAPLQQQIRILRAGLFLVKAFPMAVLSSPYRKGLSRNGVNPLAD